MQGDFKKGRRAKITLATLLALLLAAYLAAAALLRFGLDGLLLPAMPAPDAGALGGVAETLAIRGAQGTMLLRRFGAPRAGCVVYFPGQHGGLGALAPAFFAPLADAGLAVYAAAYPGQDGAPGRAGAAEVLQLAGRAATLVAGRCGATKTVVAGRSLGSMVAAYAANVAGPAGAVLESAAPSLAAGIRAQLRGRWWLRPLGALPVERLLAHDYSLAEATPPTLHVVIFQGDADRVTPIGDLLADGLQPARASVVAVPGGTHSDTWLRARPAIVATMLDLIRGAQLAAARHEAGDD